MRFFLSLAMLMQVATAWAQLELNSSGTTYTIDFETTVSGVANGSFTGAGFLPTPGTGQLDSDAWEVLECSDGDINFGSTGTSGDYARGYSLGGETTGGIYSFEVLPGDTALGFQPSGADLTPGSITLRLENTTGSMITRLTIDYLQYIYNDQPRSNEVVFSFSYDNTNWVPLDTVTSPEAADPSPAWASTAVNEDIGVLFPDNSYLYLRWRTNDVSGSGQRDEFAIDDIVITPTTSAVWPSIHEIMADPDIDENGVAFPVSDDNAEWFEMYNPLSYPVYLTGLQVEDGAGSFTISNLIIPALDSIVLGQSADQSLNGAYSCDYAYGNGFGLNNGGDELSLLYPDNTTLDEVDFSSWSLLTTGAAMRFAGTPLDDNNLETNWVVSATRGGSYASGQPSSDLGTPGVFTPVLLSNAFVALQAFEEPEGIRVMWKVNDGESYTYQLEHSYDGQQFQVLVETPALAWVHTEPSLGENFYRVKVYDDYGLAHTSPMIRVEWAAFAFYCYPNPSTGPFTLWQRGSANVEWHLEMYTLLGQLVFSAPWRSYGTRSTFSGQLSLPDGRYKVVVREPTGGIRWSTTWQVVH